MTELVSEHGAQRRSAPKIVGWSTAAIERDDQLLPEPLAQRMSGHERLEFPDELSMVTQPGLLRPTRAVELSDGTLRFLYLAAALLTPRPPGLLVLNEPETGLNPGMIGPLSELIAIAAEGSQVIRTTHSDLLAAQGRLTLHPRT